MNRYMLGMLLCMNFSNALCHKHKPLNAILVTRQHKPHTPEELLRLAAKVIQDEKTSQNNSSIPSDFYAARQRALADVLLPLSRENRAKLGDLLLWFNQFDQRTGSAFSKPNVARRKRAASVPAKSPTAKTPQPVRSKSAPVFK